MMVKPRHLPVAGHASHGVHWSPSQEPGWAAAAGDDFRW